MAYLMNSLLEPMYEDADVYDRYSLLNPYTQPYADAGMQVPQVQAAPQLQTAPPQPQAQSLDYYANLLGSGVSGGYEGPFTPGYINWSALPGYEAFWRDATGNGENYQEAGLRLPELYQYLDQNGIRVQEDPLPNNGFTRYAVDASGKPIEATRITGRADTFSDILGDAVKLAAVMGTAYLGGTALAGAGGGTAAGTAAGIGGAESAAFADLAGGLLPEFGSSAAYNAGLTEAAGLLAPTVAAPNLTPAAMESLIGTPGYGVNTAAQNFAQAAGMDVGLVGSAASAPFEAIGSSALADPAYANETNKLLQQQEIAQTTPGGGLANISGPTVPAVNVSTPNSLLEAMSAGGQGMWDYLKANPTAGRLLFSGLSGLLSASGGSSGGSGGYRDSGYRPTVARGGWQPSVTQRTMPTTPLSLNLPTTGQPNSGLWRYGLLGG